MQMVCKMQLCMHISLTNYKYEITRNKERGISILLYKYLFYITIYDMLPQISLVDNEYLGFIFWILTSSSSSFKLWNISILEYLLNFSQKNYNEDVQVYSDHQNSDSDAIKCIVVFYTHVLYDFVLN